MILCIYIQYHLRVILLYIYDSLHACMCNEKTVSFMENQKIMLLPSELDLHVIVNCHVRNGSQTWVYCENSKCSVLLNQT